MCAKLIDKKDKIEMGRLIAVQNQDKAPAASAVYYALKIEDENGRNEQWLLLTEDECRRPCVEIGKVTDAMAYGRKYACTVRGRMYTAVRVRGKDAARVLLFTERMLERGLARAERNPEDVPKMSWLENCLD